MKRLPDDILLNLRSFSSATIFNAVVESNEIYTCPNDSTAQTYSSLNPVITFN